MDTEYFTSPQKLAGLIIGITVSSTMIAGAILAITFACSKLKPEKTYNDTPLTATASVRYSIAHAASTQTIKNQRIAYKATEEAIVKIRKEFIQKIMEDMPDIRKYIYSLESFDKTLYHIEKCAYSPDREYANYYTKDEKERIAECQHSGFNRPAPVMSFVNTEEEKQQARQRFSIQRSRMSMRAERYMIEALYFCERVDIVTSEVDKILEKYEEDKKWVEHYALENLEGLRKSKYHLWRICEWGSLNSYIKQLVEWYPQNFYRLARFRYSMFEYFIEKHPDLARQIIEWYPSIKNLVNCELEPKEGINHNYREYCLNTSH